MGVEKEKLGVTSNFRNVLDKNCKDRINDIGYVTILYGYIRLKDEKFKKPNQTKFSNEVSTIIDLDFKTIYGRIRKYKAYYKIPNSKGKININEYVPMKQSRIAKEYGHLGADELYALIQNYKITFEIEPPVQRSYLLPDCDY